MFAPDRLRTVEFVSHSAAETEALGESWGRTASNGWIIGITGDLGAGKTQLVKGIARGLGVTARVHSPTFTLVNIYRGGRLTLSHLDLYRLETAEQIRSAGIEEYLEPEGVTVIEWAERIEKVLSQKKVARKPGAKYRRVVIESLGENDRRIVYEDFGD